MLSAVVRVSSCSLKVDDPWRDLELDDFLLLDLPSRPVELKVLLKKDVDGEATDDVEEEACVVKLSWGIGLSFLFF